MALAAVTKVPEKRAVPATNSDGKAVPILPAVVSDGVPAALAGVNAVAAETVAVEPAPGAEPVPATPAPTEVASTSDATAAAGLAEARRGAAEDAVEAVAVAVTEATATGAEYRDCCEYSINLGIF